MRKIYIIFTFLLSILLVGAGFNVIVRAEGTEPAADIAITVNDRLPSSFIEGSEKPDFTKYFSVRVNGTRRNVTSEDIDEGGFDINTIGDYVISITITEGAVSKSESINVQVIFEDVTEPTVTLSKPFVYNDFDQIAWDSQESIESFMERFIVVDDVDGYILPDQSMFQGIEKVKLNNFNDYFTILIEFEDNAGNVNFWGEVELFVVNTVGSVTIDVDEDLPVEFVVGSEMPDFTKYFKITDNVTVVEVAENLIRYGGFDINNVGDYQISIIYAREFIFNSNRDRKNARLDVRVIEEDLTPPDVFAYNIHFVEDGNEEPNNWTYQKDLSQLIDVFTVRDNVDGLIGVTEDMFIGIDKIDVNIIDTDHIIEFTVKDQAGNLTVRTIRLRVVDDVVPYMTDFFNRQYPRNKNINILNVANEVGVIDNYDSNENVLKIVLTNKDLFEKVRMDYMDLEKYKDRFTEEEIANAAKSYTYKLIDGTYEVRAKAFTSINPDKSLANKKIEITVLNGQIVNLEQIYEELGLDRKDMMVMYYITNFEENKNGEFVMIAEAFDTSHNRAPSRPLRIVIENGPSLALILIIINVSAIGLFGLSIGGYFGIKFLRKRKEVV